MAKRPKIKPGNLTPAPPRAQTGYWVRLEPFLILRANWLLLACLLLATLRIVSTYSVFSYTFDEPAHLACGMELLEKHVYQLEKQHPPLTRVMVALLPWLSGAHGTGKKGMYDEGIAILSSQGHLEATLALARAGNLPFFWIAALTVFACARWLDGPATAVVAVFLFTMTPTVLAHAGLATTDMGFTAMFLLALYQGWRWLEEGGLPRAVAFGACTGLSVLAKFSTLPFLPSAALLGLFLWCIAIRPKAGQAARKLLQRLPQLLLAIAAGSILIWCGYLFSFGHASSFSFSVPAPEFFDGIEEVRKHNRTGHLTYLMNHVNTIGWPYFYLVAFGVKTPLQLLALALVGLMLLVVQPARRARGALLVGLFGGPLVYASFYSQIMIGTRHLLPLFAFFAITGGLATVWLMRHNGARRWAQYALGLLLLSFSATSFASHPDYLPYFNILAGDRPEEFLVDSDLDWGQDNKRLARRLRELQATEVYYNQFAPGDLTKTLGFPPVRPLDPARPRPGWNAVSFTQLKFGQFADTRYQYPPEFRFWPQLRPPNERVGSSILLFYAPPDPPSQPPASR